MQDDELEKYLHGFLDKDLLGKPEDALTKPLVKIFGREVEIIDLTQPFSGTSARG